MADIQIPFLPQFEPVMLSGQKTMTARTKRYGNPGDTFPAFGASFQIMSIAKIQLCDVAWEHHTEEGFPTVIDFIECWKKLHPRKGYIPKQKVYAHTFKKLEASMNG